MTPASEADGLRAVRRRSLAGRGVWLCGGTHHHTSPTCAPHSHNHLNPDHHQTTRPSPKPRRIVHTSLRPTTALRPRKAVLLINFERRYFRICFLRHVPLPWPTPTRIEHLAIVTLQLPPLSGKPLFALASAHKHRPWRKRGTAGPVLPIYDRDPKRSATTVAQLSADGFLPTAIFRKTQRPYGRGSDSRPTATQPTTEDLSRAV
ncbi:hypothetical protein E4U57_008057 [Claviceps arundinis]|uniref:Uncharacterized protein n=2 Tax=Claviceps arundinis TaxID=1623583 RepID=A0ABQ7P0T6_9HYPO|nr:hypothetical protein E4U57_008057 [Claviceps arundinis]